MKKSNYCKKPYTEVNGFSSQVLEGYQKIAETLMKQANDMNKETVVISVDCYPGVRDEEVLLQLENTLRPVRVYKTSDAEKTPDEVEKMLAEYITEDRVFGFMYGQKMDSFFDKQKLSAMKEDIKKVHQGIVLVYGVGAALLTKGDIFIYCDLSRWEIQLRYRSGEIANWCAKNYKDDILRKYKRGFFIDWRVADRHKKEVFESIDFFLDTHIQDNPKLANRKAVWSGMEKTVSQPFRVVPYFDAGVWGGHWMKERFDLPENGKNYAWGFDCVPEENSLLLKFDQVMMEFPSIDLVFFFPDELLGEQVRARFGTEFPIRFDMLDTMGGQNLSLQVHPQTEYIQERFGMHYTQDESYYMLDCKENAGVYLGLKDGSDPQQLLGDLQKAQKGDGFEAEKYINYFPAKKHDHFLIPAGTMHCSGSDSMVLEISATPYIFTFKLWDWDRLGLDGLPRPVHLSHGEKNIRFERTTEWIRNSCVDMVQPMTQGDGWREEQTGLHKNEFIETRRHWFTKKVPHHTNGNVQILNLVQGEAAIVESPDHAFEPFIVHYAETFIVPAQVGRYTISPYGEVTEELATIKAFVRV